MQRNSSIKLLIKKYSLVIILAIGLLIACLSQIIPFGKVIMGLDNASTFWGLKPIVSYIQHNNFFYIGPLLLLFPTNFLNTIGVFGSINSSLTYLMLFTLGFIGFYRLMSKNSESRYLPIISAMHFISLPIIWLIVNPSLLFIAAYSSMFWLVDFITSDIKKFDFLKYVIYAIAIFNFSATMINPLAFVIFFIQISVLGIILKSSLPIKSQLIRLVGILFTTFCLMTCSLYITKGTTSLSSEIKGYAVEQTNSPIEKSISSSLINAERTTNTFSNVLRYATGWLQMSDSNNNYFYDKTDLIKNNSIFILLQLIPIILIIFSIIKNHSLLVTNKPLFVTLGLFTLITSAYMIPFFAQLPYGFGLRWLSSKTWLIISFCLGLILSKTIPSLEKGNELLVHSLLAISLLPSLFLFAQIRKTADKTRVIVPQEYLTITKNLTKDDTLVLVESAQQLYFKTYKWGYYGTDFISYLTSAQVITNATNNTRILNIYAAFEKDFAENNCPSQVFLLYDSNYADDNTSEVSHLGITIKQTDNLILTKCE